ncbi:hypothetical protein SDRG_14005 [Saprolegnia diclina VS20]|uniref:START domain-containing protein n=1 Tax=Saprolegnia diclina (strain VS20) TaxID=1156394 RepID=T0Q423_SAPDV|nr:hypothetical protein SDRG_14005 [Saprolegnia diclina VS20]EQC28180.1 hypothetical protein SDRG_14005 [Saprolegnia diclina VS20]|eukprot:XP_008618329.1 hypothetical protein SDRG_14005 [Saprolegnia diclina VS20]
MNAWYDAALPDDARAMAHLSAFLATTPDFGLSSSLTTLSSSPSSDDDSAIQAKKQARPKHEIEILHAKHNELQRQLQLLQLLRAPPKPVTPWQARAMRQAEAAQRTLQENSRLKRLVSDQRKVLSALERSLRKCPRLESPSPSYAEDTTLFQHLLQQQFDKMESEWIQRRLYDASAPLRHTTLERSPEDGAIASFRFVAKMSAPLDYKSMAQVFWTHKTGLLGPSCSVHRTIDHNIVYMRELARYADLGVPVMETHDCFGRFLEPGRVVMVWRSLGQGETITPHGADHLVGHRWGWYDAIFELERRVMIGS